LVRIILLGVPDLPLWSFIQDIIVCERHVAFCEVEQRRRSGMRELDNMSNTRQGQLGFR
jgi:hypothetical protein